MRRWTCSSRWSLGRRVRTGRLSTAGVTWQVTAGVLLVSLLSIAPASAATRTWDGVADAEWTATTNWSSGVFAGTAANGLAGGGAATDVMSRGASSGTSVGINMAAVGAGGGVGLTLAALDLASGTQSGFTIGNSSTTESGILQLNGGVTLGSTSNSYVRLPTTMTGNGTITNSVGSGTQTLGLRLGALNGVFNIGTNKTLTLAVSLSEASPGRGFIKTGGGTVVLNQPGTLVGGTVSINQGTLRVQTTGNALGGASGPIIRLGSGSNACSFGLNNTVTIANDFLIPVTTAQQTIQPSSANISPTISGNVTALGDVRFLHGQTGGTLTISGTANSVDTGAVVQFRTNTTGSIRDRAVWSGAGSLEYTGTGAGLLDVSGQKTYSGGATILTTTGGVVVSANSTGPAGSVTSGPFGTGTLTLQGGASMRSGTGNAFSVGNPVAITGDVAFPTIADEKSLTLAGPVDLGGSTRTLGVDIGATALTSALTLSGVVTNGGITKTGAGTLVLGGANTYTGATTVSAGALTVNGDMSAATGAVSVASGATLGGTGTVGGATTLASAATLAPGASPGTLTLSQALSLPSGANYNWQMLIATGSAGAANSWDLLNVVGGLSIDSTSADPFNINLWTLSGVSPDVSGNASNFNSANDYTWKIATAAGGITGFDATKFRIVTSATNGTGGFANSYGSGTFSIAQSGNDLNLVFTHGAGPSVITINVASGTQTQTQAGYPTLSGSVPVFKTGAGTLVVDQANTLTGSTTVQGGQLTLANGAALAASKVVPVAGGTVSLTPYLETTVGGLAPNAGGLVDVGNGKLTVASGLTPTDLVTAIVAGRADGSWTGTSGITSSVAAATAAIAWLRRRQPLCMVHGRERRTAGIPVRTGGMALFRRCTE